MLTIERTYQANSELEIIVDGRVVKNVTMRFKMEVVSPSTYFKDAALNTNDVFVRASVQQFLENAIDSAISKIMRWSEKRCGPDFPGEE
jgi:hypothetical protein